MNIDEASRFLVGRILENDRKYDEPEETEDDVVDITKVGGDWGDWGSFPGLVGWGGCCSAHSAMWLFVVFLFVCCLFLSLFSIYLFPRLFVCLPLGCWPRFALVSVVIQTVAASFVTSPRNSARRQTAADPPRADAAATSE